MTNTSAPNEGLSAPNEGLAEDLCAWLEGQDNAPTPRQGLALSEAWAALMEPASEGLDAAALAVARSELISTAARDALIAEPCAGAQLDSAEEFLALAIDPAPPHMHEAALRLLGVGSNVVPLRRASGPAHAQTFRLRAAASANQDQAILCKSDSGIWTLEVFVARRDDGGENASLLLSVDPDYRVTYEGLRAKVFVTVEGGERVLAEADVRDGELYAGISLDGLDLYTRDAISVVFAPASNDDAL